MSASSPPASSPPASSAHNSSPFASSPPAPLQPENHAASAGVQSAESGSAWAHGLTTLAKTALPDFLLLQRWYPAKDAGRPSVALAALVDFPVPGVQAAVAVWKISPPGQAPVHLFIPLAVVAADNADAVQLIARLPTQSPGAGAQALVEAFSVDAFARAWVNAMLQGQGSASTPGPLRAERTEHLVHAGLDANGQWAVRRSSAEQSNTSIRIGDGAILKVLRKLEEGVHPELEVGRFLTGEAGFEASPALLGSIELDGATGAGATTLSVLQAFVPNQGDGWGWMLERLALAAAGSDEALRQASRWLRRLAVRTAGMHRAFGIDTADPDFRPEPVVLEDLKNWTATVRTMATHELDRLAFSGERLEPQAQALAASVVSQRALLEERLDRLLQDELLHDAGAFSRTRHHGDYHLGQVLVADGDAVIVDFEGEPLRPLAERRAKHAALRDVAGMLRSLAYVAAAAGRDLPRELPAQEREAAVARLADWEKEASRAFLDAYLDTAQDTAGCPSDRAAAERVVRFFMLEKALYEIAYELANRPDWVAIPLRGVLALLDADATAPATATVRVHRMPFGAELRDDGAVRFRLWAPPHAEVEVELDGQAQALPMQAAAEGWHELVTDRAHVGSRYRFVLPDGLRVPDPASRHQPEDVHGPSEVVDPGAYRWRDDRWRGRPWHEAVVYELHLGAFTQQGSFNAAIGKFDHLVALGVTAIELMPISDFPGGWNWGYDGVLPYAPDSSYGRPEDLKGLIDAAHARGLMVLLDVVYNHFGPEGAYLHAIAPQIFTERHKTPWGAAINTDGDHAGPVREFFIHNALYWIEEFHLDGLRLDAVHAILDDSPRHLLEELAERVHGAAPDRHVHLILENEENQASRLVRREDGSPRWYTAQWNDDVHHVLHVAVTGESSGYYGDYNGDTGKLARALAEGFAFQGEVMPYRGHERGEPSSSLPPTAFVAFLQNHDQVGNRAFGDRVTAIAPPEAVRAAAVVYLLLPQIPMLFMGEEWGAAQAFPFFCDFGPDLADAVRDGRREEFARFPEFQDPAMRERIPDPMARETFFSAKLRWDEAGHGPHKSWLDWYRRVLATRRDEIVPRLPGFQAGGQYEVIGDGAIEVRWSLGESPATLVLAANLSATPTRGFAPVKGRVLWREGDAGDDGAFGSWSVRWSVEGEALPEVRQEASDLPAASALDNLAGRMGIEAEFRDARGATIRAGAETKRSLLAAMGVAAADDAQAREALASLDRAEWLRPLPPVQVVPAQAGPPSVELVLPAGTEEVGWRLTLEDGSERSGRVAFDRLELLQEGSFEGRSLQRRRLVLDNDSGSGNLPWGYHHLAVEPEGSTTLVVTPSRCWLPAPLGQGRRLWGIAAQLYLLRSAKDWGIGDFGDLRRLVELAATRGADVIGLNPLHAMFHDNPEHASPYSPASRVLLNVLYIDVMSVPELEGSAQAQELVASQAFQRDLEASRGRALVDYSQATALKLPVLEMLFAACRASGNQDRWQAFEAFQRELGEVLQTNCLYFALREHFASLDPAQADWHAWPEDYRDPASSAVARFAQENRDRLEFLVWLQWVADEQLGAAATSASHSGMMIGLYRDLAVGADRAGAETWANSAAVVSGAQVGAPPDIYNTAGQDWGLPPFHPRALREEGYRSFVELVRANMRHAGGLRIDHVMGLQHLYWVPQGQKPSEGAYVQYPLEDLLGILALESHRQRCLVVGEDLGTVPEGFRERMAQANVLSYRILFFEQDTKTGAFLPPAAYPALALAVVGSHDLPTLRGWWEGRDLDLKERLGLFPDAGEATRQREGRERDRVQLTQALRIEGLLPDAGEADVPTLALAAHTFLARTPSVLAMAQIDDLTDEVDPVNVPATSDQHPNWRRRLSITLEELAVLPRFSDVTGNLRASRGQVGT